MNFLPVLTAALGAVAQEVAYWYDLRGKLAAQRYRDMMNSGSYWVATAAMVFISALGTAVWFAEESQSLRTYLITGAAFPLLLKKGISILLTSKNKLGGARTNENTPQKGALIYFRES